ncbi:MAG: acyltransferase [Deltaproteobacteria bacterium]|nr:acyltransferase [Deltaproteobacteria bacterium]
MVARASIWRGPLCARSGAIFQMSTSRPCLIYNVQLLRAFAALSVVFEHVASQSGLGLPYARGAFGVDIFFVISGFIISYIASADPSQFMVKRIIRIVPFYWAATTLVFCVGILLPSLLHTSRPDLLNYIRSLFFIPYDTPAGAIPIMGLGWTLNYEIYFYAVFAISLVLNARFATRLCAIGILAVMFSVEFMHPASPARAFYGQTIVVDLSWQEAIWTLPERFLTAGIPAAIVVFSMIVLEREAGITTRNRTLLLVGEASYIIYLIHPYVAFGILRTVLRPAAQWPESIRWLLLLVFLILVSFVSILVHLWFERPVMSALRARLLHKPSPLAFQVDTPAGICGVRSDGDAPAAAIKEPGRWA